MIYHQENCPAEEQNTRNHHISKQADGESSVTPYTAWLTGKPREVTTSTQKSLSVLNLCCSQNSTNFSASAERRAQCQDMRDITIYKNSGDRGDCSNYCSISLLSIVGKTVVRVILSRLQTLAELVCPDAQCGFHRPRCTTDMLAPCASCRRNVANSQSPSTLPSSI